MVNLESAVNLTWVFVDCARKSEYLEEKAQGEDEKLHIGETEVSGRFKPATLLLWGGNTNTASPILV